MRSALAEGLSRRTCCLSGVPIPLLLDEIVSARLFRFVDNCGNDGLFETNREPRLMAFEAFERRRKVK